MTQKHQNNRQKLSDEEYAKLARMGATKAYSYDEIAKELGISASWVGQLLRQDRRVKAKTVQEFDAEHGR